MTLVAGSATSDIGFLVSDTLLSAPFKFKGDDGPVNGEFHALKIQILNPDTAVAFATANDVELCFNLVNKLQEELRENRSMGTGERLFELYSQTMDKKIDRGPPDCEFLILQLTPERKKLIRVTKDGVFNVRRAYIGDPDAYRQMTELRRPHTPPKTQSVQQPDGTFHTVPLVVSQGEIEFAEVSDAMERLTNGRRGSSVDALPGGVIRVVDAKRSGELEYLQFAEASLSPEEGHSGFSTLASNSGVRGVGIYYRSGRVGFLFVCGDFEPCRKEHAATLKTFIEIAHAKHGLVLEGATWTD